MSREVHVFGQGVAHRLDDLVGGQFEYWVVVDRTPCLTIGSTPTVGQARLQLTQTPDQKKLCNTRIIPVGRGNHIKVQIPLKMGRHTVTRVIRRREAGMGSPRTDIGLDYVTRSMSVKFHYPPELLLEVVGHGDLEPAMAGLSTVTTPQPDQNEFDQYFQDSWFRRGASLTFLLSGQD